MGNHLHYGNNPTVLREQIRDAFVDLICLDPPFNSTASCNVLFKGPTGTALLQQIPATVPRPDQRTFQWKVRRAVAGARRRVGKGACAGAGAGKTGRACHGVTGARTHRARIPGKSESLMAAGLHIRAVNLYHAPNRQGLPPGGSANRHPLWRIRSPPASK
ncbi:MAG: hypothetical protein INF52_08655 [Rhodobacter sp.]|nr:hypothetical protein [Rhodobacter sp.]